MKYEKSAAKTAKLNRLMVISSKLIADFSELKNAVDAATSGTIFNQAEVYNAALAAFTDHLSKHFSVTQDLEFVEFFINHYRFCIDISFNVTSVYDAENYKRKYNHISVDAARIAVFDIYNDLKLSFNHNENNFKRMYRPIAEAYTA